jgi:hypothetical protein
MERFIQIMLPLCIGIFGEQFLHSLNFMGNCFLFLFQVYGFLQGGDGEKCHSDFGSFFPCGFFFR